MKTAPTILTRGADKWLPNTLSIGLKADPAAGVPQLDSGGTIRTNGERPNNPKMTNTITRYIDGEGRLLDLFRAAALEIPLSEKEFLCCCDANNTYIFGLESKEWGAAANVEDSGPDGLGEKWGVDLHALAQKLDALSIVQRCALLAAFDGFFKRSTC